MLTGRTQAEIKNRKKGSVLGSQIRVCVHINISEVLFSVFFCCFFRDTLILQMNFRVIQINDCRGDLSDSSATTATLIDIEAAPIATSEGFFKLKLLYFGIL